MIISALALGLSLLQPASNGNVLSDGELSTVRGGAPSSPLATHVRTLADTQMLASAQAMDRINQETFDNWFANEGTQLIAANAFGPAPR